MSMNQPDFADQHRRTPPRKPSAASESFITALALLFFVSLALLFQYLDRKKSNEIKNIKVEVPTFQSDIPDYTAGYHQENFPDVSSDLISGDANTDHVFHEQFSQTGIHPPFPSLNVAPQTKIVDAGAGLLFTSKKNSVITIPPNAFLDKNGNRIMGNVEVNFREFYNYMDIFLSGIPMHYNGGQLESAGMFEITASKDNEPVYVNPENKISVMLASLKETPGYNMYYFDQKSNQWIEKGESKVSRAAATNTIWENPQMIVDSTEVVYRFYSPEYSIQLSGTREPARKKKSFFSKQESSDGFSFHFNASENGLPELNAIRNIRWKYKGNDAMELFNKIFLTTNRSQSKNIQRNWKYAFLEHQEEDDTYLLTLTRDSETISFKVIPRLTSEKSIVKFQAMMDQYFQDRQDRITAERNRFEKFQKDSTEYFASNSHYKKNYLSVSYVAMRQFQIDGFGVWNCDRPAEMPQATTVFASFVDMNGQLLTPIEVYHADKSINTVYTYYTYSLKKFKFNPDSDNLVWALFPGNVMAVIKPAEFQEKYAKSKRTCRFKMTLNKNAELTQSELKKQLTFDL